MTEHVDYTSKEFWRPLGRVAVFIDAANIFYSQRSLGWTLDFKKFYPFFRSVCVDFVGAWFYFALWFDRSTMKRVREYRMMEMLSREGFEIIVKESKRIKGIVKANCDVELAIDAVRLMNSYDTFVLLSGDGDFAALCRYLRASGKKVVVVSQRRHFSFELRKDSHFYIPLERFEKELRYQKKS